MRGAIFSGAIAVHALSKTAALCCISATVDSVLSCQFAAIDLHLSFIKVQRKPLRGGLLREF
jgi:hypothetical protein